MYGDGTPFSEKNKRKQGVFYGLQRHKQQTTPTI